MSGERRALQRTKAIDRNPECRTVNWRGLTDGSVSAHQDTGLAADFKRRLRVVRWASHPNWMEFRCALNGWRAQLRWRRVTVIALP